MEICDVIGVSFFDIAQITADPILDTDYIHQEAFDFIRHAARDERLAPKAERDVYRVVFAMSPYRMDLKRHFDQARKKRS